MKDPRLKAMDSEKKEVFTEKETKKTRSHSHSSKSSSRRERKEVSDCLDCLKLVANCSKCRKNKKIFDEVFFSNLPNIAQFFEDEKSSKSKSKRRSKYRRQASSRSRSYSDSRDRIIETKNLKIKKKGKKKSRSRSYSRKREKGDSKRGNSPAFRKNDFKYHDIYQKKSNSISRRGISKIGKPMNAFTHNNNINDNNEGNKDRINNYQGQNFNNKERRIYNPNNHNEGRGMMMPPKTHNPDFQTKTEEGFQNQRNKNQNKVEKKEDEDIMQMIRNQIKIQFKPEN